jgi:hypothetical protein
VYFFARYLLLGLLVAFCTAYVITWLPIVFQLQFSQKQRLAASVVSVILAVLLGFGLDLELPNGILSFPAQIFGLCAATASVVTVAMSIVSVRSRKPD